MEFPDSFHIIRMNDREDGFTSDLFQWIPKHICIFSVAVLDIAFFVIDEDGHSGFFHKVFVAFLGFLDFLLCSFSLCDISCGRDEHFRLTFRVFDDSTVQCSDKRRPILLQ